MDTRRWAVLGLLLGTTLLSGCSAPALSGGGSGATNAVVMKSTDGGATYEAKDTIDAKQSLTGEVLSFLVDRSDSMRLFIGTRTGIYASTDGAETWKKLEYLATKVYGLAQDPTQPGTIYATGEWQKRGKVYRSDDGGTKWTEVYTEPADGTVVTALVHHPTRPGTLLIGLSTGVVVRTDDRGATWSNVGTLAGPVIHLAFDDADPERAYAVIQGRGMARSTDGGRTFAAIEVKIQPEGDAQTAAGGVRSPAMINNVSVTAVAPDPHAAGTVYAGTEKDGILRSTDGGDTWRQVPVIDSAKKFPVRSVVVSPFDPNEIMFGGAAAVYRSTNGGANWSTYQIDMDKTAGTIRYDGSDRGVIYLGFRTF